MTKKHLVLLLLLVLAVATGTASTWKIHNYYVAGNIQNVLDTGDKIYYLNSNRLFQFDKTTLTTVPLNRQNMLSDNQISQIYYDWESRLLFVAYANSNIDVIDAAGNVRNIAGIKDVVARVHDYTLTKGELTDYVDKTIRDITFGDGKAYVAMGYGYAVVDEATFAIIRDVEVHNNICVNSVARVGASLVLASNKYLYYGDPNADDPINTYAKRSGTFSDAKLFPVNDHSLLMLGNSKLVNYDFSTASPTAKTLVNAAATCVQKTPTGFIANFANQSYYYAIDAAGLVATKQGSAEGFATADPNGDGTVWINDATGLHMNGSDTSYKINSLTTDQPYWLKYNAATGLLYVANTGAIYGISPATDVTNAINTYDGHNWADETPYAAYGGAYGFEVSPLDPTTYVRASWIRGIHKVTNGVLKTNYTKANAKIGGTKPTPTFDNYGNLWVVCSYFSKTELDQNIPSVAVLPAAKFAKETATRNDWLAPAGLQSIYTGSIQRSRFLVSKKNNYKIFIDGDFPESGVKGAFFCWDNGVADPAVDNYRISTITRFVDQNDRQIDWTYVNHMEQDKDGNVWVGHTQGLFMFDPDVVFDEMPRGVRPFVSSSAEGRGTLCEGCGVYDIGVDRDNNKWLATDDGVYFVSPDGSEVYNHFTTYNSDLPGNMVYSVECDTVGDRVYVYTDNGFAEYVAEGDAAALNFDDAYVYPNPVEPDFTGLIKMANLMDDTYVTITDNEGHIVAQMGPVMGSALWDACYSDGQRVPTGIYNIYAAQGSQPALTGAPLMSVLIIR